MLTAVVIDDEEQGRKELSRLLTDYCQVQVVASGHDVDSGIEAIRRSAPQIVFLDIHLGARLGFDILLKIPQPTFSLVITTADDGYALRAFDHFAISYLLKPVTREELTRTIRHIEQRERSVSQLQKQIASLGQALAEISGPSRIAIPHSRGLTSFDIRQIVRFEAEGAYTRIIQKDGTTFLASKNLHEIEEMLAGSREMVRVHRSAIININEVVHVTEARYIMMSDGEIISLSRSRKDVFWKLLKK